MDTIRRLAAIVCALVLLTGPGYASGDESGVSDEEHGTNVPDGVIRADTTWMVEDSPITFGNIQIAAGATLTIEPGVEINAGKFVVQGALSMVGTAAEPILLSTASDTLLTSFGSEATVEIRHAEITGTGASTLVSSEFAALTLTDSTLTMLRGGDFIGSWTSTGWGRIIVERNVFTKVGRIVLGHAELSFKHNRFRGNANRSSSQIESRGNDSDGLRVEGNVFEPSARPLLLGVPAGGFSMSAPGNFFGSTDLEEVGEWVVDGNDFLGRPFIDLAPLLSSPPPEVPFAVPSEPLIQGVIPTLSGGYVTWEKPDSDGGTAITHYEVRVQPANGPEDGTSVDATVVHVGPEETSAELTGLDSSVLYAVSVLAWNNVGASYETRQQHLAPLGLPRAPIAPTTRVDSLRRSITLTWDRPNHDGGSGISSYIITALPGNHTQTVEATRTTATFTELSRGTNYTFTVQAVNEFGTGPASLPSEPAVIPYTVPGRITDFTYDSYDGEISLAWKPPSETGGTPVTGYTIHHHESGQTHTTTEPRLTVSGTGERNFTIRAVNVVGAGEPFRGSVYAPVEVPWPPRMVRTKITGSGQVTVTWQAPSSDGNSPITGYVVTESPGGQTKTVGPGVTSVTFTGLRTGLVHDFNVRARNKVGASDPYGTGTLVPQPGVGSPDFDVYTTPGQHKFNGRDWRTSCQMYSPTVIRCTTEIWATQVSESGGQFSQTNGWVFNNLTYAASPRGQWTSNPLAAYGVHGGSASWTASDGRRWRTECDTATTGRNGCRSYIQASVIESFTAPAGGRGYRWVTKEIFNNMVRFS